MPPRGVGIMSRVIAVIAWGLMLAACSATMPSLDFLSSAVRDAGHRIRTARSRSENLAGSELSHSVSARGSAR